ARDRLDEGHLGLEERVSIVVSERGGPGALPHPAGEGLIAQETAYRTRDVSRLRGIEQETGDSVLQDRRDATTVASGTTKPTRHGFDERLGMTLGERGQDEAVGRPEVLRELAVRYHTCEVCVDPGRARPPREIVAQAPVPHEAKPRSCRADQGQPLDEAPHVL